MVRPLILAFLIGLRGSMATVQEMAEATGYTKAAVRSAASDMALARFVQETTEYPVRYFVLTEPRTAMLGLDGQTDVSQEEQRRSVAPAWRHWASLFAFLAQAHYLLHGNGETSDYLLSSRARDLFEQHHRAFSTNHIIVPNPKEYRGASYLKGFLETVETLRQWATSNL